MCVSVFKGKGGGSGGGRHPKAPAVQRGRGLKPESLEGHRLICILAQRWPPGDPELRWDRAERLAAFRRSSPPVRGERESAAALIASAGKKKKEKKKAQKRSKNTSEGRDG